MLIFVVISFLSAQLSSSRLFEGCHGNASIFNYQVSVWKEIFKSDIFVILGVTMRRVLVRLLSYC